MELSNRALQTAVRVLKALNDARSPEDADIKELRQLAPLLADESLDFLAREVIQQALLRRAHLGYGGLAGVSHAGR